MCAFKAGSVVGEAEFDDRKWQDGTKRLKTSNKSMTRSMFDAQVAFNVFKKGVRLATQAVKDAIQNAISFSETQNKFNVVFGKSKKTLKDANKAYENLTDNYGLSNKAALELLSSTGDLLTGLGFTAEQALGFSETIQELSVDLASFQNLEGGAEQASEALTKALLGETEQAKALGIVIRQGTAEFKDGIKALVETEGLTELQAKAQLVLTMAYEQSKNAVGDYARTSMSLANMQRLVKSETENLSISMGKLLLPIVKNITKATLNAVAAVSDFIQEEKNLTKIQTVIANIGAGFEVFGAILKDVGVGIFQEVKSAVSGLMDSLGNLFGDLKGNINVFDILGGALKIVNIGLVSSIKFVKLNLQIWIDWITVLKEAGKALVAVLQALINPTKWKEAKAQLETVKDSFGNLTSNALGNIDDLVSGVIDGFKEFPESAKDNSDKFQKIWDKSLQNTKEAFDTTNEEIVQSEKDKNMELVGEGQKSLSERKKILDEWDSLQKKSVKENIADIKLRRDEFIKAGVDEADANKQSQKEIRKAWADQAVSVLNTIGSMASQIASIYTSIFDTIMDFQQQELDELKAKNDAQIEEMEMSKEEQLETFDEQTQRELEIINQKEADGLITKQEAEEQTKALEERRATEKAALEKGLDDKIAEQKKKNRSKEVEQEKKMFEAQKANKIAMVWINAAIGIVGAWAQSISQLGPIAGAIFAGILTAAILGVAIAQTVVISQQKFIPGKQEGGMAGGNTRVNEAGGEIITLPDGSQVIPNDISRQIAGGSGGGNVINMNISFRGAQISNEMNLKRITDHVSMELGRKLELAL